jgi:hypothetical protein
MDMIATTFDIALLSRNGDRAQGIELRLPAKAAMLAEARR